MFTLKNLNVVRIVETERQKATLISQGFKELETEIKQEAKVIEEDIKEEVKKDTKKGKE